MGFEAWLGKTVVDSNLKPSIITIHMVVGLIIIALLLFVLFKVSENNNEKKIRDSKEIIISKLTEPPSLIELSSEIDISVKSLKEGFKQV